MTFIKARSAIFGGLIPGDSQRWWRSKQQSIYPMKTTYLLALTLSMTSLLSAEILKVLKCHDEVVRNGVETLVLPKQAEALFGTSNVDHFISNFGSKTHPAVWNSVAYFADRYMFTLRVPIVVDYDDCKLVGASNSAMIQVNEIIEVRLTKSGIANARMKGQWRLNENEWRWLIENNGDWSVVDVPVLTNAPITGFEEYVRQAREPIRYRQAGFDDIIRQTIKELQKRQAKEAQENASQD